MSNYYLKTQATDMYQITLSRAVVGFVRKVRQGENEGKFVGKIGDVVKYEPTAQAAFDAAVRACNRIAICGEDNEEKAREVIAERNAETRARVEQMNAEIGYDVWRVKSRKTVI